MRLGSTKPRLTRGWIKKFFLAAVGVTAMNLHLTSSWITGERGVIDGTVVAQVVRVGDRLRSAKSL